MKEKCVSSSSSAAAAVSNLRENGRLSLLAVKGLFGCQWRQPPNCNSRELYNHHPELRMNLAWIFVNARVPILSKTPAIELFPPSTRERSFTSHRQHIRLLMLDLMKLFVISSPMFYRYRSQGAAGSGVRFWMRRRRVCCMKRLDASSYTPTAVSIHKHLHRIRPRVNNLAHTWVFKFVRP